MLWLCRVVVVSSSLGLFPTFSTAQPPQSQGKPSLPHSPTGQPAIPVPSANPLTPEKIELGKLLYFDKRLSADQSLSCASCHDPNRGWSNAEPNAEGFGGARGNRNSPTILNAAFNRFQFWDGRAASLEEQALGPISNPIEMNLPQEELITRLKAIPGYQKRFQDVFQSPPTPELVGKAIAAFERTIVSGNAPYDRFKAGDTQALSEVQQKGMRLFFGKANCSSCHAGPNFTDHAFHNVGVGMQLAPPDPGRFVVSKLVGDTGAFKTPPLRDIQKSSPYMHDGSLATLKDVVDYYSKGGHPNPYLDEEIYAIQLTEEEKLAIVAFLSEGLESDDYPLITPPDSFPE